MKVFRNRILKSFKGKDKKDDAEINYSLMPQPDGNVLRSTDFLSSLDLLCEGEIEGFVNPDGALVKGIDVLQAVYLNDVPILEVESNDSVPAQQGEDTIAPEVIISGDNPTVIELGQELFVDEGADSNGGEAVSAVSDVNDQVLGSYTVTYSATDASGNTSTATRTVEVFGDNISLLAWGVGGFNSNDWVYDSQDNEWSVPGGPRMSKNTDNQWELRYGTSTVYFRTTSSYTSDVPLNIPRNDWNALGGVSSIRQIGFIVSDSEYPSSSITLQNFGPTTKAFNGTYSFTNGQEMSYTKTTNGETYYIYSRTGVQSAAGFRWTLRVGGNEWFWSDDFDPTADIDNILDISLGGFTNAAAIPSNYPQPVIGTIT